MSKIATETATAILAMYAGQTVTQDDVFTQITQQYALARKRTGFSSYFKVCDLIESAGATRRYDGPKYTGTCLYTFPVAA